jgi:hypothetical protein
MWSMVKKKKKFIYVTNLCTFEPWPLKIAALCSVKKKYWENRDVNLIGLLHGE